MQALAGEHSGYAGPLSGIRWQNKSYLTERYSAPVRRNAASCCRSLRRSEMRTHSRAAQA